MTPFKEINFTPNEFASLARIDKTLVPSLEQFNLIHTHRKKVGNVERKLISLAEIQNYFKMIREFDEEQHQTRSAESMGAGANLLGMQFRYSNF